MSPGGTVARAKTSGTELDILPHSDAHSNSSNTGDHCGPYLERVRALSAECPPLEYLTLWTELTTSSGRWVNPKHTPEFRAQRAAKTKVGIVDICQGSAALVTRCDDIATLEKALSSEPDPARQPCARLVVVEDLSRDLIESLGSRYDIDPWFFRYHVDDYALDDVADPRDLFSPSTEVQRARSHVSVRHPRARYFSNEEEHYQAKSEIRSWNVSRRADIGHSGRLRPRDYYEGPGGSAALCSTKTSLWVRPSSDKDNITAVLLLDPTITIGEPLWGHTGSQPFPSPTPRGASERAAGASYFEQVLHWSSKMTKEDIELFDTHPRFIGLQAYRLILHDWLATVRYLQTRLARFNQDIKDLRRDPKASMDEIAPLERVVQSCDDMLDDMDTFLDIELDGDKCATLSAFKRDIAIVRKKLDSLKTQLSLAREMWASHIGIEHSIRSASAQTQNKSTAGLTVLATIFLPLNFATSFLSMSSDFSSKSNTIWLFFAIGIPLLSATLTVGSLMNNRLFAEADAVWHWATADARTMGIEL